MPQNHVYVTNHVYATKPRLCHKTTFMSQNYGYLTKLRLKLIQDVCETCNVFKVLCLQEVVSRVSFSPSHLYDNWGQMFDGFNYLRGITLEQETVSKEIQKQNLNLQLCLCLFLRLRTYIILCLRFDLYTSLRIHSYVYICMYTYIRLHSYECSRGNPL